ncbi:MAG TPA: class I SAM-dependent methyltransferase [Terriglobia bacterium]|nr:class I SAM-dependent methyltransferase [Terriglobia bacterium]
MLLAKVARRFQQRSPSAVLGEICLKAPAYFRSVAHWQLRTCRCCRRLSIFASNGGGCESVWCALCGANLRYELLAQEIRERFGPALRKLRIVEFDPGSPLEALLSESGNYTRTFFSESVPHGEIGKRGARCEDITSLTFPASSVDLMVSSDVLEHVVDLESAFRESARVLVPGGVHLFTVPYHDRTRRRVAWGDGQYVYLEEPEYHLDPLNRRGILAAWDVGPDLPQHVSAAGLTLKICRGPVGPDRRVVWMAEKTAGAEVGRRAESKAAVLPGKLNAPLPAGGAGKRSGERSERQA